MKNDEKNDRSSCGVSNAYDGMRRKRLASANIEYPGVYEIRGELFGPSDNYGVGLPKDSDGVAFINEFLRTIEKDGTWAELWKICFGDRIGGIEEIPEPPAITE